MCPYISCIKNERNDKILTVKQDFFMIGSVVDKVSLKLFAHKKYMLKNDSYCTAESSSVPYVSENSSFYKHD